MTRIYLSLFLALSPLLGFAESDDDDNQIEEIIQHNEKIKELTKNIPQTQGVFPPSVTSYVKVIADKVAIFKKSLMGDAAPIDQKEEGLFAKYPKIGIFFNKVIADLEIHQHFTRIVSDGTGMLKNYRNTSLGIIFFGFIINILIGRNREISFFKVIFRKIILFFGIIFTELGASYYFFPQFFERVLQLAKEVFFS